MGKREEDCPPAELSVHPTAEGSTTLTNWSGLVGTTSKGSGGRKGREKALGSPVKSSIQQLEQAQLAIAELYQENRELQSQLAAKNQEVSVSQGHGGSTVWLQRQLREAQDTIVQLREAQRMAAKEEKETLQGARSSPGEGAHRRCIMGEPLLCVPRSDT
jgi:hypothetical protein